MPIKKKKETQEIYAVFILKYSIAHEIYKCIHVWVIEANS